jgi:hypothetical protein
MKNILLLLVLFAVSFTAQSENLEDISNVLKHVESEHDPAALGDWRGDTPTAFGILQIRKIAIDDVNRVYNTSYTVNDAFDIECSEEIFKLYIDHWTNKLEQREGRQASTADIVRIWNGGPRGYQKNSTKWYLKKFLRYRKNRYLCKVIEPKGNKDGIS